MPDTENRRGDDHPITQFLELVREQITKAEKSRKADETVVVSVFTPEGRTIAHLFDGAEPNRIIVHGYRQGHKATVIAPLDSVHVAIDVFEQSEQVEEPKQRQIGFACWTDLLRFDPPTYGRL